MIDWSRVDELRAEVGDEDFAEIAELFLSEIEGAVGELPGIADLTSRSELLHGMKGAAMNLGFQDLATLCASGERTPAEADIPAIATVLAQSVAEMRARYPALG
jgi:HPt (histidine-containing phosphotransfer) domain-containing protein